MFMNLRSYDSASVKLRNFVNAKALRKRMEVKATFTTFYFLRSEKKAGRHFLALSMLKTI
jgi:hypothetical protein